MFILEVLKKIQSSVSAIANRNTKYRILFDTDARRFLLTVYRTNAMTIEDWKRVIKDSAMPHDKFCEILTRFYPDCVGMIVFTDRKYYILWFYPEK